MGEIVGRKAPHIHRNGHIFIDCNPLVTVFITDFAVDAHHFRALHDLDEQHRVQEEDDFIFAAQDPDYDEMPDAGGKMVVEEQEWDDEYWAEKYEDPDRDFQIVNKEEKEDKEEN